MNAHDDSVVTVDIGSVVPLTRHLTPVSREELEVAEASLGIRFPSGYVELMAAFGPGQYLDFFWLYQPSWIVEHLDERRREWSQFDWTDDQGRRHWFFEGSEDILGEEAIQAAVPLGDSADGDALLFHPGRFDRVYILPRHDDTISWVRADLTDLATWSRLNEPRPLVVTTGGQTIIETSGDWFSLAPAQLRAAIEERWGAEALVDWSEWSREGAWTAVGLSAAATARIQVHADDGETHSTVDRRGIRTTFLGSGRRTVAVRVDCDPEAEGDLRRFLEDLESGGAWRLRPA